MVTEQQEYLLNGTQILKHFGIFFRNRRRLVSCDGTAGRPILNGTDSRHFSIFSGTEGGR
jgi:hypothetical protein